ncbi:MAG: hypothetical protein ACRESZ_06960 [Methylococcales bacterium]
MAIPDNAQLEYELLALQKDKVVAEIAVLRKTTPLTETIKVLGSMVLAVGGAVAAFAGFQLAEVKAERYKLEAAAAATARDNAKAEIDRLTVSRDTLKLESVELIQRLEVAKKDYATISDKIAIAQRQTQSPAVSATLQELQQNVNAADIELRSSLPTTLNTGSGASLNSVIEKLFAPPASVRGAAYEELMARFSKSPDLVPRLLHYAERHMDNQNGVYNTLVVLSHLDNQALPLWSDLESIRTFANQARAIGPKTSERSDKVLEWLPQ